MKEKKFDKQRVYTISFAHLMHDVFSSFLAPLLPLIIEKLGISFSMVALLDIVRRIPSLFNPILGLIAERRDVKYLVIFTPLVTALSMSFIGLAPTYSALIILLFVSGISSALFHIPSPTMIKDASANEVGKGMSYYMVGGELARTLGPLLVTYAVSLWGLEGVYNLLPLAFLSSFILYIKIAKVKTDFHPKERAQGDVKALLLKYRAFFTLLAGFILFQAVLRSSLTLYLPVYLVNNGASLAYAGISLAVLQFFGVLGVFFSGKISDKIGRGNTLMITSIGAVFFMALFLEKNSMILLSFLGFFLFSATPVLMALVQDTNSSMPTFMNSIYMAINFGVGSLAVFSIGYMGDMIGLNETFFIANIVASGTIVMAFVISKYRGKLL